MTNLGNCCKVAEKLDTINFSCLGAYLDSCNRSGRLNYNIPLLNMLSPILYRLNRDDFIKILSATNELINCLSLINQLDYGQKIDVALASDNPLVKFAVLWLIINYGNNAYDLYLSRPESSNLSKLILQFSKDSKIWEEFKKFIFSKITMNINLHHIVQAIGQASSLAKANLVYHFFEQLPIVKYSNEHNIANITRLIFSINDVTLQRNICKKLFLRWASYVDGYTENLDSMLLTNFIDLAIHHVCNSFTEQELEQRIDDILSLIDIVDNIWFNNITEQNSFIYKQVSKLFILCFGLKKLGNTKYLEEIKLFLENLKILKNKIQINNIKTSLTMFQEYIFNY